MNSSMERRDRKNDMQQGIQEYHQREIWQSEIRYSQEVAIQFFLN